jgi:hypothetical protein
VDLQDRLSLEELTGGGGVFMRAWLGVAIVLGLGCASTTDPGDAPDMSDGSTEEDSSMDTDAASPNDAAALTDAAGPDAASEDAGDGAVDGGEPDAGPMCSAASDDIRTGAACPDVANGVYGIKTVLDVWWQDDVDPPLVDAGRGRVTVLQKATLSDVCDDGSIGHAELQLCGLIQPPTVSWVMCQARQLEIPDAVWDSAMMPRLVTTGTVSAFGVDGVLSLTQASGLIGISLPDKDGPWPSLPDLLTPNGEHSFLDHDGDGRPGIAMRFANIGTSYRASGCSLEGAQPITFAGGPLDFTGICYPTSDECDHAAEVDVGLRTQLSASGSVSSCGRESASIIGASSADSIALGVASCVRNDGTVCNESEIELTASMMEPYNILAEGDAPPTTVLASPCDCTDGCTGEACPLDQTASVGPRSALVRLGDADQAFDCASVRDALAAAYPGTAF